VQSWNAAIPISVTDAGIVMLVNEVQRLNAPDPNLVVPSGMIATPFLISNCAIVYNVLFCFLFNN
jgi:hypothetical protein